MSSKFGMVTVYCVRRSVTGEVDFLLASVFVLAVLLLSLLLLDVFGHRWIFCWCLRSKSRLANRRPQPGKSPAISQQNGFSLVCDLSCRLRCSSLANGRVHVVQTYGLALVAVFGAVAVISAIGFVNGSAGISLFARY